MLVLPSPKSHAQLVNVRLEVGVLVSVKTAITEDTPAEGVIVKEAEIGVGCPAFRAVKAGSAMLFKFPTKSETDRRLTPIETAVAPVGSASNL